MIMNCVIIDDEELPKRILLELIKEEDNLNILEVFDSSIEALKYINTTDHRIDLIFLDVMMPSFDGFDFIRALKTETQIIIISSDKKFAINTFDFDNITDYLLKPIRKERLKKALHKARKYIEDKKGEEEISVTKPSQSHYGKELFVNADERLIKIEFSSIKYIEARGNFILIKTTEGNQIVYSSLKKIEDKLPADSFFRVHRSFIINFKKIIDIKDNSLLIEKEVIPISRRNKKTLMERLNLL